MSLELIGAIFFVIAAVMALAGTNRQAALARRAFAKDSDPDIAAASVVVRPGPEWTLGRARRRQIREIESRLAGRADAMVRYRELREHLRAWNNLESSVALALAGSLMVVLSLVTN